MAGLQGSGKTTACAKLAKLLKKQNKDVALAACDLQRPAAVEQLEKLGAQAKAHVYSQPGETDAVKVAAWARDQAVQDNRDVLIVDTAGRLHVDQDLMDELAEVRKVTKPLDVLLVVDAMTGQDAVNVAESFAEVADFDGVLITKLDGDARGGAALSVRAVTGKPIIYASTGEKLDEIERFHPDRMAGRILGMGDVMSLIEKTQDEFDDDEAADLERKIRKQQFTLDDFLQQMKQVRRMGPLGNLMKMIPGMGKAMQGMGEVDERELDRIEAIILSMTPYERAHPDEINGSRRKRIATGSGTTVQAVNRLVKQFGQMSKLMKQMSEGKMPDPQQLMRGMRVGANLRRRMSVRIRLRRVGSKKNPIWRVVVADQRSPRDGRTIETIGQYNPQTGPVADRDRRGPRQALAGEGRAPDQDGRHPAPHQGHPVHRRLGLG